MKRKFYYDIADELFEYEDVGKYATMRKLDQSHFSINETTFNTSKNPFNKEKGTYCSFNFNDLDDDKTYKKLCKYLTKYLNSFIFELTKKEKPSILFVGLGNENYIPDSLGPSVVKNINANYFFKKQIGCLIPGVMASTGMETADIVKGVLKCHDYDLVIVIDSLATASIKRLNKTIQITDTGISPGSGVNNFRKPLTYKELKVKVLTIGIATVIPYQKIIEEYLINHHIEQKVSNDSNLVFTTKEIEHQIDYLSMLLVKVINDVIN